MSFGEKIREFADSINEKLEHVDTEETTKIALILPFLRQLGYDTANPSEVKAEFTADVGAKRGEKVDIAILNDNNAEILIECKSANLKLEDIHFSQLYRYFNITHAQIGILTNGIIYKFFTDSNYKGKMDDVPFLEMNLLNLSKEEINELEKFTKEKFDISRILSKVDDLKYSNQIKKVLKSEIEMPSDEFIKIITKQVYDGPITKKVRNKFSKIVREQINFVIDDKIDERLKEALEKTEHSHLTEQDNTNKDTEIITTKEEIEGFYLVKSILSELIDMDRVTIRDHKSYCNILLDNNKLYPICRMHFNNTNNMKIGFFDSLEKDKRGAKKESQIPINDLKEIHNYKDKLLKTVRYYERIKN